MLVKAMIEEAKKLDHQWFCIETYGGAMGERIYGTANVATAGVNLSKQGINVPIMGVFKVFVTLIKITITEDYE